MGIEPLDALPIWSVYLITVLGALLLAEAGYQLGKRQRERAEQGKEGNVGALVGSTLALLAFLLVFLTGIASGRFDNRRELVIQEANAVGTTYLRAGYLAEPHRTEIRQLLSEYVDVRLEAAVDDAKLPAARVRSEEIHTELWAHAETLARDNPNDVFKAIFVESLNDVIDIHTERIVAVTNRVPVNICLAIYFVAGLTMAIVGYQNGLTGERNLIALVALILVFSAVILLIVDLDRPQEGLLTVSQQALIDLQAQLGTIP